MITAEHLAKRFTLSRQQRRTLGVDGRQPGRELQAVDDLSLRCRPGRIFALLGPNGAGKTTALRMIATLLRPDAGRIEIAGIDALKDPVAARRKLGFLTGSTRLYERLTAEETLRYYADLAGVSAADYRRRRDALFASLGIDAFADRRVGKLSTGMQQKVSIARTIIHDPEVIVFDEATSGLDVIAARAIIQFIRKCRDDGKTVLFSTHIMSEVTLLADDLAIVHGGRTIFDGTLAEFTAASGERSLEEAFIHRIEASEATSAAGGPRT
ncbi:ATP-binding cassette domain-containing protein [Nannocystis sp.]|uniref:ABC transporter ATP-binding protein n=1 Tax=Nannocystis sp. TaxID=1962667 RepID=UPI0024224738|nr:ATP-binding cassette domain-containing protein [Nannocystis sp.]MBK7828817.1 ATP-binding cassette domain-containing protein [Nannocystis sp.]MBK9756526.1 ATP-binding cassette domain-containing protein [Nannocystis sp.]